MSNISRRDFLKTAGVMTLAVAAAGVLAGCEGNKPADPEANKPEVTTNSVSYTSYTGDKLTVESLGRFNVYASHDAKDPQWSQTVLKVTWTKPEYSTVALVNANNIGIKTENYKNIEVAALADVNEILVKKFGLKAENLITDATNTGLVIAADALTVEKYIVLKAGKNVTNDLKVTVNFKDDKGEQKELTMPLSVTASDLY